MKRHTEMMLAALIPLVIMVFLGLIGALMIKAYQDDVPVWQRSWQGINL